MSKVQSIRPMSSVERDAPRLALAAAIAEAATTARNVADARGAIGLAHRLADEAEERVASATEGVTAARDAMARRLTRSATEGKVLAPDPSMRAARDRLTDAEDERDVARIAVSAVSANVEELERLDTKARERVARAARVVLGSATESLVAEVARADSELSAARGALWFLYSEVHAYAPTSEGNEVRRLLVAPPEIQLNRQNTGAVRWIEYFEALKQSADAVPPTL
jgi:hypothetical protein